MHYTKFVRDAYDECVRLHPTAHSELKIALKSNERVPSFVDALAKEVAHVQDVMLATGKEKIKDETIKHLVYDLTNLFISTVQKQAEERMESDAAKLLRKAQEDYRRDLDKTVDGEVSGDFIDIFNDGVKMSSERNDNG